MRINFRQGIITYPSTGVNQTFLVSGGGFVSLRAGLGRVDIAFAQGNSNYLLTESTDVDNAWGPLPISTDCWLYVDINPLTGARTFGFTTTAPVIGSIAPAPGVAGLTWFDTATTTMYEYTGVSTRRAVIRAFVAKVNNNTFTPLGTGVPSKPFAGTQVGISGSDVNVGRIIADDTGRPIRRPSGSLFTTEDDFFIDGSPVNVVRIDATVVNGEAMESMAKFQVVKFSEFGKLELAGYNDTQTTAIAMLLEDLNIQEIGTVCIQGKVTNPDWNWTTVGAELWIEANGLLTETDPHVSNSFVFPVPKPAVARVLTPDTVIFDQGLGGKGERGASGLSGGVDFATPVVYGVARLSVPAGDNEDPVVVGTNDPRLNDKVFRSGDTMTGPLILSGNPTVALGAVTKQYVDTRVLDDIANVSVFGAVSGNGLVFNGTNWVAGVASSAPIGLNDLTDVTIVTPDTGDQLVYIGGEWVNQPTALNDLSDVNTTGVSTGNLLAFNGTNWVPAAPASPDDIVFVFQVGSPGITQHYHYAPMTAAQAEFLISGTNPTVPVGDPAQPTITIAAVPNSNPLDLDDHTHDVTVVYDYTQQTFTATNVTGNGVDNHIALLVGKGGSGGGGDSLWESAPHVYPTVDIPGVAILRVGSNLQFFTDGDVLGSVMDLTPDAPGTFNYTIQVVANGELRSATIAGNSLTTVSNLIALINASPLGQYVVVSAVRDEPFFAHIIFTGTTGVTSVQLVENSAAGGNPFMFGANRYNNWSGYTLLPTTTGTFFEKTSQAIQPINPVGALEEVYLDLNTYVESNEIAPITYEQWTLTQAHSGEADDSFVTRTGAAIGQPGTTNGFLFAETPLYTAGTIMNSTISSYGSPTLYALFEARNLDSADGGAFQTYNEAQNRRIAIFNFNQSFGGAGTTICDIAVGNASGSVYGLLHSQVGSNPGEMVIVALDPYLDSIVRQYSFFSDPDETYGPIGSIAVNPTNNYVAAVWTFDNFAGVYRSGFHVTLHNPETGVNLWTIAADPYTFGTGLTDIAIDPTTGDVVVMVSSYYNTRLTYLARFAAATGALLWEQTYNDNVDSYPMFSGLAIDPANGQIYLGGTYFDVSPTYRGMLVALSGATGNRVWARDIATPTDGSLFSRNNTTVRVAVQGSNVYMGYTVLQPASAYYATDIWLGSFTNTGTLQWQRQFGQKGARFFNQFQTDLTSGSTNGAIAATADTVAVTFNTFFGETGYFDISAGRMATYTMDAINPATGQGQDGFRCIAGTAVVTDGAGTIDLPSTASVFAGNTSVAPTHTETYALSSVDPSIVAGDVLPATISPGVGVPIPTIEPSLEVKNVAKVGSLMIGDTLPPPVTLRGSFQDLAGMFRVSQNGIWYCFADYTDGQSDIWKFATFNAGAQVFSYSNASVRALPIHIGNIVMMEAGSTVEYRIPRDHSMFPIGTTIVVGQSSSGQVRVVAEDSYTASIFSPESDLTRKQYAKVTVFKINSTDWHLEGNLEVLGGGSPIA